MRARSDIYFTGRDGSMSSNRMFCQVAGLYATDLFIGSTLQIDLSAPDNGMDRPCSNRVNGNAAEAQLIRERERAMTDIAMHNDRIATIGMDLGKRSFHLIGMDARGKVIMRQQLSRGRFERHMANLQPCLVGVEACAGAHHIGRQLSAFGHNVRLIPAQYVKPFRKGQKNDYRDAEAIAEAVQRPTMRFVPIKSAERGLLRLHSRYGSSDRSVTKVTFVTRLQPCRSPGQAARQLPDQSTTLWVESSSTDDSRLRGARPTSDNVRRGNNC